MPRETLIGRKEAYQKLDRCMARTEAQLIIVCGRRRVGKTYLVNQYFKKRFDFKLTGAYKASQEIQLENFSLELSRRRGQPYSALSSWREAFFQLRDYLSELPDDEKHVVFLDEMPWMDSPNSGFLPAFEYFWNAFGSAMDNLILIVCGSSASWIAEHIEQNKGGLFNRKTCKIQLEPFSLSETEAYLKTIGIEWSRYEITQCYMVLGGIPYYLSFLAPDLSLNENIDSLFFQKSAELSDEFDQLYRTLFEHSEDYIAIVKALSQKRIGLTKREIAVQSSRPYNGELSKKIRNLVDSGFVRENSFFGKEKRDQLYQLADYFTLFYFRFVRDHYGIDERFWSHSYDSQSRYAWAGLTFEQVCRDHVDQIKQGLGISGVLSKVSTWYARPDPEEGQSSGAQIDMIIDRKDHVITLCEIKYSIQEFEIDKEYDRNLRNKIWTFRDRTKTRKTLHLAMITTFGVTKGKNSSIVSGQVTLDDLFRPKS